MKILSVNAGSSSLKFTLFEMPDADVIVSGTFEKIKMEGSFYTIKYKEEKIVKDKQFPSHKEAVETLLAELIDMKIISSYDEISAIGHRVLHGGDKYFESIIVNDEVIKTIDELASLGPLHNPANAMGIRSFKAVLPNTPQVAVFDTAFHQTMDKEEFLYAIPLEYFTKYAVRKYGFHGTSHKYISQFMNKYLDRDIKFINCHIGNGASVCAIEDGKCKDTSMGMTPLTGVMMGTRCGDVDPSIIPYIMDHTGDSLDDVLNTFNKKSGILGISNVSSDMREVESAFLDGDERSILAINMYVKKIVNYIAQYYVLLGGCEAITFTAGVGENSGFIREKVCDRLACLGVKIDKEKNKSLRGKFDTISTEDSKIAVYVVPTNEEEMIATDTLKLIS